MPGHMTVTGEKQGKIEGSCDQKGREGTILVQGVDHTIHIPRDIQTGLATGKRVHGPLTVTKVVDKSSPLLYQALCTGEQMKDVTIKLYRISKAGTEEHYFTTTLVNAIVVSMRPYIPNCLDKSTASLGHMEEISFTYQKVTWRHEIDKKESQDDWKTPIA
jgi:type VI secretion system secreted protein Hcp